MPRLERRARRMWKVKLTVVPVLTGTLKTVTPQTVRMAPTDPRTNIYNLSPEISDAQDPQAYAGTYYTYFYILFKYFFQVCSLVSHKFTQKSSINHEYCEPIQLVSSE